MLYIANSDGTNLRQLTDNGRNNYLPAWSPDGGQIAYVSGGSNGFDLHEIYVINADGSDVKRVSGCNLTAVAGALVAQWHAIGVQRRRTASRGLLALFD